MTLGHKQKSLIELGESKGFIDNLDLLKYYNLIEGKRAMNSLIILGHFNQETINKKGLKVIWEITKKP